MNVLQVAMERAPQPESKLVPLGVKFNGDPQQLGFFPTYILTYMQVYRRTLPSKEARVTVITLALEGTAAQCPGALKL